MLYRSKGGYEYKHFASKAFWIVNPENNITKELFGTFSSEGVRKYKFFLYYKNAKKYTSKAPGYISVNRYNIDNLAVDDFTEEGVSLAVETK